ncbi:MAG: hypothetical protein HQL50_07325 [Magnetococcales bacterium]|nr:hypothetical protein [Magnetococcales bacterium]
MSTKTISRSIAALPESLTMGKHKKLKITQTTLPKQKQDLIKKEILNQVLARMAPLEAAINSLAARMESLEKQMALAEQKGEFTEQEVVRERQERIESDGRIRKGITENQAAIEAKLAAADEEDERRLRTISDVLHAALEEGLDTVQNARQADRAALNSVLQQAIVDLSHRLDRAEQAAADGLHREREAREADLKAVRSEKIDRTELSNMFSGVASEFDDTTSADDTSSS